MKGERILAFYDNGEGTRDRIAQRYRILLGMVKKLLQQRRHRSGRKPPVLASHGSKSMIYIAAIARSLRCLDLNQTGSKGESLSVEWSRTEGVGYYGLASAPTAG